MNILVIQILRLGDALQLTPIIEEVKTSFPGARVSVLTSSLGKKIFERQPHVEEVFVLHKQELIDLVRLSDSRAMNGALALLQSDLAPVVSRQWDWVINFSFSFPSALLTFMTHGKRCSGFYATEKREYLSKDRWFAYSLSAFPNRKLSVFNWVDINRNIVGARGGSRALHFPLRKEEVARARDQVQRFRSAHNELIGIHPGASGNHKRWPIENFIQVTKRLVENNGQGILIFGDQTEQNLGRQLEDALGSHALNLAGRTSLPETAAFMSQCSLIVCNDSGPMHLAAAVGTPILALFFSTHFVETGPYGENHLVMHPVIDCFPCQGTAACADRRCLDGVPVEAVEELINRRHNVTKSLASLPEGYPFAIAVNRSRFDPWGFLEWVPAFKRPFTLNTLIKLIYRLTLISHLTDHDVEEKCAFNYVRDVLSFFDPPSDMGQCREQLQDFLEQINRLETLLTETRDLCAELIKVSSAGDSNTESIRLLGKKLGAKENALLNQSSPHLDLIARFIGMQRDNLDERDFLKLATQSIKLYTESIELVSGLEKRTGLIFDLLQSIDTFDTWSAGINYRTHHPNCQRGSIPTRMICEA